MTIRNAWYGVCLLAAAFGASDMVDARSSRYSDRWYYCSRGVNTEADLDFHRDLLKKAKAGGYNGMLYAHGLDYWYAIKDRRRKENFQRLRSMCAEAGVEIIPLIWSTGYGAFAGADLELAECEPATGIAYVARGGQAVFEPGNTTFANGDFAQYDRDIHAHRLKYRHREKLLVTRQEHDIAQVVHLVHELPVDYPQELHVSRRICGDLLYLVVTVGYLSE